MIIYNVTININNEVHDEWIQWMREIHIPKVMQTGVFTESKILRLIGDENSGGVTYAIQYACESMSDYEKYRDNFAAQLQQETLNRFKDKFVAFRTLLETV